MQASTFALSPLELASFLMASSCAFAQTAPQPDTPVVTDDQQAIPTVTITASADASAAGLPKAYAGGQVARGGRVGMLGNISAMDAPFNSLNFTHELMQDQQARSVADVLQNDPSVRVARGFGNFQELYMIRGFPVFSDDVGYNGLYGLLPRQYVSAELLERVEVFRGANTFLNGAAPSGSGVGGAVNLLPKRAANTPLTQLTIGGESGGQASAALDVGRRFGPGDRFGVRVNAARRDGDTAVDREKHELSVLAVGLDYRGDDLRISGDIGYQDYRLTAPRPSVTAVAGIALPAAPDSSANFAQPWTYSNERDTFGTLRAEYDIAKDVVAWAAFGARSGRESNSLASLTVSNTAGTGRASRFDNERKDTVRTGEAGVRAKLRTGPVGHTLAFSTSVHWLDSRNAFGTSSPVFATNLYTPIDVAKPAITSTTGGDLNAPATTHKSILSSYAVADTLAFADDRVLLTVGARRQTIKDASYSYVTRLQTASYDKSDVTPVAGLVYKITPMLSAYGNYIEALQKGAVASGTVNGRPVTNVGEIFAPYTSRQKELGIKYDAGTLGMNAAVFTTSQPSTYIDPATATFGVFGQQRNRGIELSAYGVPLRGVRVLGGLTLLDAEQQRTVGGTNNGKDVLGVPDTQLNLGAEWDVPTVQGLALTARTVYTASQYADAANTQQLPSWTRVDLSARYTTTIADRTVTLRARVDNVADRNYWASAGGASGAGYLVLGAPRTFALNATIDF
jgi:iron complex outermembrane receptor protein